MKSFEIMAGKWGGSDKFTHAPFLLECDPDAAIVTIPSRPLDSVKEPLAILDQGLSTYERPALLFEMGSICKRGCGMGETFQTGCNEVGAKAKRSHA
jgi:hypothetical protein